MSNKIHKKLQTLLIRSIKLELELKNSQLSENKKAKLQKEYKEIYTEFLRLENLVTEYEFSHDHQIVKKIREHLESIVSDRDLDFFEENIKSILDDKKLNYSFKINKENEKYSIIFYDAMGSKIKENNFFEGFNIESITAREIKSFNSKKELDSKIVENLFEAIIQRILDEKKLTISEYKVNSFKIKKDKKYIVEFYGVYGSVFKTSEITKEIKALNGKTELTAKEIREFYEEQKLLRNSVTAQPDIIRERIINFVQDKGISHYLDVVKLNEINDSIKSENFLDKEGNISKENLLLFRESFLKITGYKLTLLELREIFQAPNVSEDQIMSVHRIMRYRAKGMLNVEQIKNFIKDIEIASGYNVGNFKNNPVYFNSEKNEIKYFLDNKSNIVLGVMQDKIKNITQQYREDLNKIKVFFEQFLNGTKDFNAIQASIKNLKKIAEELREIRGILNSKEYEKLLGNKDRKELLKNCNDILFEINFANVENLDLKDNDITLRERQCAAEYILKFIGEPLKRSLILSEEIQENKQKSDGIDADGTFLGGVPLKNIMPYISEDSKGKFNLIFTQGGDKITRKIDAKYIRRFANLWTKQNQEEMIQSAEEYLKEKLQLGESGQVKITTVANNDKSQEPTKYTVTISKDVSQTGTTAGHLSQFEYDEAIILNMARSQQFKEINKFSDNVAALDYNYQQLEEKISLKNSEKNPDDSSSKEQKEDLQPHEQSTDIAKQKFRDDLNAKFTGKEFILHRGANKYDIINEEGQLRKFELKTDGCEEINKQLSKELEEKYKKPPVKKPTFSIAGLLGYLSSIFSKKKTVEIEKQKEIKTQDSKPLSDKPELQFHTPKI